MRRGGHFAQVFRNVASPKEWLTGGYAKMLTLTGNPASALWPCWEPCFLTRKRCTWPRKNILLHLSLTKLIYLFEMELFYTGNRTTNYPMLCNSTRYFKDVISKMSCCKAPQQRSYHILLPKMCSNCVFASCAGRLGAHSLVAVQGRADLGLQQASK